MLANKKPLVKKLGVFYWLAAGLLQQFQGWCTSVSASQAHKKVILI